MAKTNPLFIDSTKIHGDRIGTQVELSNVILFDNETISITVMSAQGDPTHIQLTAVDEKTYSARVWLRHLERIRYQFVIECEDRRLFHTAIKTGHAGHEIVEVWDPVTEETAQLKDLKRDSPDVPRAWVSDAAKAAESLMAKFDL